MGFRIPWNPMVGTTLPVDRIRQILKKLTVTRMAYRMQKKNYLTQIRTILRVLESPLNMKAASRRYNITEQITLNISKWSRGEINIY